MPLSFFRASLIFFILFMTVARAQTVNETTLIQTPGGYSGTWDTTIQSAFPSQNYGTQQSILLKSEPKNTRSALVRFSIFHNEGGPIPDGAVIQSAFLSLYKLAGPRAQFNASRLKRSWQPLQATWDHAATGTLWGMSGALNTDTDVFGTPDGGASVGDAVADGCMNPVLPEPASCWLHIDVLTGVQAFAADPADRRNYGWRVAIVGGGDLSQAREFKSSEHPNLQYQTLRPKLRVTWSCPAGGCSPDPAQEFASPLDPAPNGPLPRRYGLSARLFAVAEELGLEGIVAKRADVRSDE
jgi:hypothetical protein